MAKKGMSLTLKGAKEYTEILNGLPFIIRDQVLRSFNRKAASTFVVKPLRSVLPYSRNTTKNIKVLTDKKNKTAVVAGPTSQSFWLRFVEKGTVERKTKKGASRGKVKARSIIEPFVDGQINSIINFVDTEYGNEIDKFIKKKILRINKKNN